MSISEFDIKEMLRAISEDTCVVLVEETGEIGAHMSLTMAIGYARGINDYGRNREGVAYTAVVIAAHTLVWPLGRYGESF